MAPLGAKFRRRIWRIHRFLLRPGAEGQRRQHCVPDCLGADRIAGGNGSRRSRDRARCASPGGAAASRWVLGREGIYGHRISLCVLSEISFVPELFSIVRARAVPERGHQDHAVLRIDGAAARIRPAERLESELRYPLKMTANLAKYVATQRFRGTKKFPIVLMLEPLHACNLTCTGCGRIREYKSTINEIMTVEQCLAASDECGAPIVSICGGEPMIYPEIG